MATNPLDTTATAIWTLLQSNADFLALFPANTVHQVRENTTNTYAPTEDLSVPSDADYPICRVTMQSAKPGTERDSSHSFLDVSFAVEICTGSQQQSVLRDACWAVYRAMLNWRTYVRDVVTWVSVPCVYDVDAADIGFTDQNENRNRGTNQWIAVWSTVVRFSFATADLDYEGT